MKSYLTSRKNKIRIEIIFKIKCVVLIKIKTIQIKNTIVTKLLL